MGQDGGEAGRRMAAEDELIRRELQDPTAFCNSFWGFNDGGYPVVQSRMKCSQRIVEEVRGMYKERAEIEAEYARRLAKLAKQAIGKDETGSMRAALDVVRTEIEQTARTHADLSAQFKKELEGQLAEFQHRTQSQRKDAQANIEKLFKQKQTQESYVNKSRDRYEQDCVRINGYTAQSSLVQGRDLEKVTSKLDKAQSTVNSNDKDYQNFVRALKDTTLRWNAEWKSYLDQCQDMEEERLEFLKSNLWNYANTISAMCVADDQSCERVRVSLEQCEAPRDIIDFIQRAGTGSAIPDAPEYINYARGQPPPARPTFKTANFSRTSTRSATFVAPMLPTVQQPTAPVDSNGLYDEQPGPLPPSMSVTGDGFGGGPSTGDFSSISQAASLTTNRNAGYPSNIAEEDSMAYDTSMRSNKSDKRMSAKNFLARTPSKTYSNRGGGGAASMQTSTSTQHRLPPSDTAGTSGTTIIKPIPGESQPSMLSNPAANTGEDDDDPIARALADLRMKPSRSPAPQQQMSSSPSKAAHAARQNYSGGASAEFGGQQPARARSPSAAFMQAPERATSPLPVEEVLDQYGQSFPGERRSVSRQNSNASRRSRMSQYGSLPAQQQPERARSPGPVAGDGAGFAGVGARGRSPSPQPFQKTQPQPQQRPTTNTAQQRNAPRPTSVHAAPQRSTTPLGISLDASGSVTHDQMADDFIKRTGSVGPHAHPPPQQPTQQQQQQQPYGGAQQVPQQFGQYAGQHGQHYASVSKIGQSQQPLHQVQPPYAYTQQQVAHHAAPSAHTAYNPALAAQQPVMSTPPPQQHQQSHLGSLGRASGSGAGYHSPSPYNQRPASATAPVAGAPPAAAQQQQYIYAKQATYVGQHPAAGAPAASMAGQFAASQQAPSTPQDTTPASAYMQQYRQQQQQQQQHVQSTPSIASPYAQVPQPQAQQQMYGGGGAQHAQSRPVTNGTGAAATTTSSSQPAAPPTGQYSETGKPILFYVKALYDYQQQMDEEFSFTAGDIIAVWETNPDGWWQGELLDDARRRGGANTFPSNFVSLLN